MCNGPALQTSFSLLETSQETSMKVNQPLNLSKTSVFLWLHMEELQPDISWLDDNGSVLKDGAAEKLSFGESSDYISTARWMK